MEQDWTWWTMDKKRWSGFKHHSGLDAWSSVRSANAASSSLWGDPKVMPCFSKVILNVSWPWKTTGAEVKEWHAIRTVFNNLNAQCWGGFYSVSEHDIDSLILCKLKYVSFSWHVLKFNRSNSYIMVDNVYFFSRVIWFEILGLIFKKHDETIVEYIGLT